MCCTWFVVVVSVRSSWSDNESVNSHRIKAKMSQVDKKKKGKKLNSAQTKPPLHDCNGAKQKYTNEELCLHETNGAIHPIRLNSNSKCYRISFWLGWKTWCYFQLLSYLAMRKAAHTHKPFGLEFNTSINLIANITVLPMEYKLSNQNMRALTSIV